MHNYQTSQLILLGLFSLLFSGCSSKQVTTTKTETKPVVATVITQEQRNTLTPDDVTSWLKAGNQRFVSGVVTNRDHSELVRLAASGQYPKGIILSCIDSRVPIEDVFDLGIGDVFVARVAGNFENTDILGSMEYACKVAGSKLVVVLGH